MAAVANSRMIADTPVSESYELFNVDMDVDATIVITPTNIKSITEVNITPTNLNAALNPWYATIVYGAGSFTLNSIAAATFDVTVRGVTA